MYIRNDEFTIQNQEQSIQKEQSFNTESYNIRECKMCSTCPHVSTCSMINGNIDMPESIGEPYDKMTRQYHMNYPHQYHPMQHHGMMHHPYYHPYYQPYHHPYYHHYYNPYFNPNIIAPWLVGSLLFGNYDNRDNY